MKVKFTFPFEFDIEFEGDFTPARPAPPCSDHDSPNYSDPGDDEYLEGDMFFVIEKSQRAKINGEVKDFKFKKRIPVPEEIVEWLFEVAYCDLIDDAQNSLE